MTAITGRLDRLERSVEEIRNKKLFVPVLIVREAPRGVYTNLGGNVFDGDDALHRYAARHGTVVIINDDIPRTGSL